MRVLVIDDSAFVRRVIQRALTGAPGVEVVITAASGAEALARLTEARPDVVTLDLDMPEMDGLTLLGRLRTARPALPVVVLTVVAHAAVAATLDALDGGAVDFVDKSRLRLMDLAELRSELLARLGGWVRRAGAAPSLTPHALAPATVGDPTAAPALTGPRFDVCVIGASTGGPPALHNLLAALPGPLPWPLVIAQHMPRGFSAPFAGRLATAAGMDVAEASAGETLAAGKVRLAPAGAQTAITRARTFDVFPGGDGRPHAPSVDVLFASAAEALGGRVLAVLLPGMGDDGARGLGEIRRAGGTTIAESEDSCVVFGMPRAAIARGAAAHVLPLADIRRLFVDAARGGSS
jgi:two-component system chemotaxis response regulator CheB